MGAVPEQLNRGHRGVGDQTRRAFLATLDRFAPIILGALLLLGWQIIVPLAGLSEFVLPTPLAIGVRIIEEAPLLLPHTGVTVLEVLGGFGLSVAIGIPLALLIFYSRIIERALFPILVGFQTIPIIVLAPLIVLYLGYGWAPKITLAFLISFFPLVISTVVGLQSLDPNLVRLVHSMGANEWQTFYKVRLPAALPNVFGGCKVAIALAVIGAIIGEYVAAEQGLGYLQLQATAQFDMTLNYATVVVIAGVGISLYNVLRYIEKRVSYDTGSSE